MDAEEYLSTRVDDQLAWYESKANRARRRYKTLRAAEFVSAALVPLVVVLGVTLAHRIVAASLGAIAAASSGFQSVNRYQENWVEYRAVAERLKSERFSFLTGAAPYDIEDKLQLFVTRVESILCGEHDSWGDRMQGTKTPRQHPDYTAS